MRIPANHEPLKSDLLLPWVMVGLMLGLLMTYIIICHVLGAQLQQPLPEAQRVLIRTAFYAVAIATFPLTNLIRHIQLRLNQTMPMPSSEHSVAALAKSRYLATIIVSMSLIEVLGVFGLLMFMWGDDFNTLYIFIGLSALGLFLYRPKHDEYSEIINAIAAHQHE